MVFGPLFFPLSLTSEGGENKTIGLLLLAFVLCGGLGFALCWRFTRRYVEKARAHVVLDLGSRQR